MWDVESATGKGVLNVGHSKNETSKRKIPLNGAARDAITRMLKRADELGQGLSIGGCAFRIDDVERIKRAYSTLGGALLVDTSLAPSRVNVSSRQSSPPGEKGVGEDYALRTG